ncbi:MAG: hypothetical protein KJ941_03000, partial [Bacteroidetes bacterium]|nr:hypothetical protein [Bacteroidota bacterium]
MKLYYNLLLGALLAITPLFTYSQQTATIGAGTITSGTSTNAGVIYRSTSSSSFDFSQQYYLYTQSELALAGIFPGSLIQSVAWNKANTFGTDPSNTTSVWQIYMKNSTATPSSTWSSSSFTTQSASATLVYNNPSQVIPATTGWITLTLSSPFTYTGGSLEIGSNWDCSAHTGSPTTGGFSWMQDAVTTQAFGGSAGSSSITMSSQANRPQIQIGFVPGSACSGAPTGGTTNSSANPVCPGVTFNLSVSGSTAASGLTYQWQSSTTGSGYTDIVGATSSSYSTSQSSDFYYRRVITCVASAMSDTSAPLLVNTNSFINCYCTSNATSASDTDLGGVHIGTLSNVSTCSTTGGAGSTPQQYSDYTALPAPNLARSA